MREYANKLRAESFREPIGTADDHDANILTIVWRRSIIRILTLCLVIAVASHFLVLLIPDDLLLAFNSRTLHLRHVTSLVPLPVLPNGNMADGTIMPLGWSMRGRGDIHLDRHVYHSAPASLHLTTHGNGSITAHIRMVSVNGPFLVHGFLRTQGNIQTGEIGISVQAWGKQQEWLPIASMQSTSGIIRWQQFTQPIQLPSIACDEYFTVNLRGNCQVWLDDLSVTRIGE